MDSYTERNVSNALMEVVAILKDGVSARDEGAHNQDYKSTCLKQAFFIMSTDILSVLRTKPELLPSLKHYTPDDHDEVLKLVQRRS